MSAPLDGWALPLHAHTDSENLHPASYFSLDPARVKAGFLAGFPAEFRHGLRPGIILFGGRNFGAGSSREVIVQSFVLNGVRAVCAENFARIFFRNAINFGLPALELPDALDFAARDDAIRLDLAAGRIENRSRGHAAALAALEPTLAAWLARGVAQREDWIGAHG